MGAYIVTEADWPELLRRAALEFPRGLEWLSLDRLVSVITDDDQVSFSIGGVADDGEGTPQSSPYITISWARLTAKSIVPMAKVYVEEWIRLGYGDLPMVWWRDVTGVIDRFSRRDAMAREERRGSHDVFELTPRQVRDQLRLLP